MHLAIIPTVELARDSALSLIRLRLAVFKYGDDWKPLAMALEENGIELSDEGEVRDVDDVIDELGTPDLSDEAFHMGYDRASRDFHYEPERGEPRAIADGADHYRAVYRGLDKLLDEYKWADAPFRPAFMREAI